jgi:ubiquitin C-terminal hydrolase
LQSPDDEGAEDRRALHELAAEAWRRHLQRNQSMVVDLFQGQLRCQTTCPVCGRPSTTFDPFLFLSVPVPVQMERAIKVRSPRVN